MAENKAPYIKSAKLKGYKSIKDLEIELLPGMNIIIGANGSGKSNFLELVEKTIIADLKERYKFPRVDSHVIIAIPQTGGYSYAHQYWKADPKEDFSLYSFFHKKIIMKINYTLPLLNVLDDNLSIQFSSITDDAKYFDSFGNQIDFGLIRIFFNETFENKEFIADEIELKNNIQSEFLKNSLIQKAKLNLKSFTPIQDFRLNEGFSIKRNKEGEIFANYLKLEFLVNDEWLDWQQLSDGTKRLFYIVAEVTAQEDTIILLEEPELGVHPHQLHKLMNFLKEQSEHKQIIITTHSPQVLNILTSDELNRIVVADMTEKGTKMRHLTDTQIKKAQKYMASELSLGDYWEYSDLEPQNTAL
jgi:predicted ATP-dependent endonuclease of OLD family